MFEGIEFVNKFKSIFSFDINVIANNLCIAYDFVLLFMSSFKFVFNIL